MARNHFAIERPRKISIAIQGYDADASARAQQKKQQERAQRQKRQQQRASRAVPPKVVPGAVHHGDDDEIERLAVAAAVQPVSREAEQQLLEAFAGECMTKGGGHAHE